jgi:hypothetical protein
MFSLPEMSCAAWLKQYSVNPNSRLIGDPAAVPGLSFVGTLAMIAGKPE